MALTLYNGLDEIQQAFARSMLNSYVTAWRGGKPPVVALSGAGGTGKSTAIAAGIELIEDWLTRRFEQLTRNDRNSGDAFDPAEIKSRLKAAPNDGARRMLANLYGECAVERRKTASERKDEQLMQQAEAVAFAVHEVIDVNF